MIMGGNETAIAEEIVSVLKFAALRVYSEWGDAIRYTVRGTSLKLRSIVLDREALRHLLQDPIGAVKIDYLKRDLLRCAERVSEYHYPRTRVRSRHPVAS
ncbi:MAG: hypothetical protein DMF57_04410 [Acidobacteria bacterium]|nr:MAG: hypothetical protein DMF57_04410 [Acidobacteriota bacterium]